MSAATITNTTTIFARSASPSSSSTTATMATRSASRITTSTTNGAYSPRHLSPAASAPKAGTNTTISPSGGGHKHAHLDAWSSTPSASARTIYLGQVYQQVTKDEVGHLIARLSLGEFRLFWRDTTNPAAAQHDGWVWVEFRTEEMAVKAKKVLAGLPFRGRKLRVGPVVKVSLFSCFSVHCLQMTNIVCFQTVVGLTKKRHHHHHQQQPKAIAANPKQTVAKALEAEAKKPTAEKVGDLITFALEATLESAAALPAAVPAALPAVVPSVVPAALPVVVLDEKAHCCPWGNCRQWGA